MRWDGVNNEDETTLVVKRAPRCGDNDADAMELTYMEGLVNEGRVEDVVGWRFAPDVGGGRGGEREGTSGVWW